MRSSTCSLAMLVSWLALAPGCGGGGGNDVPVVTGLEVAPASAAQGAGGGLITVAVGFDASDEGKNLAEVETSLLGPGGQLLRSATEACPEATGATHWHFAFSEVVSTEAAGGFAIRVRLVDRAGNRSELASATFTVLPP